EAYDQLAAEGWIEGRAGSGTRVRARAGGGERPVALRSSPRPRTYTFATGLPDLVAFPRAAWLRALRQVVRTAPASELGHNDPRGLPGLRAELAAYLARVRGVHAHPAGVAVTHGFTHGLGLL